MVEADDTHVVSPVRRLMSVPYIDHPRSSADVHARPGERTAVNPIRAQLIGTDRLELLPLEAGHADEMAVVLSDPALYTFIGGAPATAAELRSRYTRMIAGSPEPGVSWCNWVIQVRDGQPYAAGGLVGTVQATVGPGDGDGSPRAEIAWVVGTPWQRHGFAKEAARGLVQWLDAHGAGRVIAHVHPDNEASAAVATATGLTPTGVMHHGEIRWCLSAAR
jgi:RimJ/RimL family protein N-acetyltransferase